ncbi:MAG: type II toxin-antitoxin system prevent-host-death family antitoxin [Syntrophales bacterium]|nr:type II toxin-antitoxin system prevent-host-death family antitoxin [Syntrophales bacterium]
MKEETIAISKFKATCLAVLNKVKQTGQPVLVTRRGEPIALIEPPPKPQMRESWLGMFRSRGTITGDIVSPAVSSREWEALGQ